MTKFQNIPYYLQMHHYKFKSQEENEEDYRLENGYFEKFCSLYHPYYHTNKYIM